MERDPGRAKGVWMEGPVIPSRFACASLIIKLSQQETASDACEFSQLTKHVTSQMALAGLFGISRAILCLDCLHSLPVRAWLQP